MRMEMSYVSLQALRLARGSQNILFVEVFASFRFFLRTCLKILDG